MNEYGGENRHQGFAYTNGSYYPQTTGSDQNTPAEYNYSYNDNTANGAPQPQKERKKGRGGFLGAIAATAAAGALAGSLITGYAILPTLVKQETAAAVSAQGVVVSAQELSNTTADNSDAVTTTLGGVSNPVPDIAESARKSVVGIIIYEKALTTGREPVEQKVSSGSGFVISEDGYILTNAHVVNGGNVIKVRTHTGEEYVAELVGKDSDTELAVLKVEGLNLPAISIGDSTKVRTGDFVVAIGNPVSAEKLQNTVTVGYISSESREMQLNRSTMNMLQTDAAINPGNSGGPLLNDKGEVIGINTMKTIYAGSDEYGNVISAEGIGFAIPISDAMEIVDTLIKDGGIVKPGIGFTYSPISDEDAKLWNSPRGIVISEVAAGSPAQEAGLKEYDIITKIDGVDLTDGAEVPSFKDRAVGDQVPATVWRDGKEYDVTFTLADLNKLDF